MNDAQAHAGRQRRWALWLSAWLAVACAVNAPSLRLGLFGDDFAHRRFVLDHLNGVPSRVAWWNMFDWRVPDRDTLDPGSLFGRLPWWAGDDFSFALLRPLSTVSHYLDYVLWPQSPWLMHLHNIALLCLLLVSAAGLYRRLFGFGLAAWIAVAAFAIDDAHSISTAWIASRNTLLTANWVLLTLAFHWRATSDGKRWQHSVSALTLLAAHASSEGGIVVWAYLIAYTLFLDARTWAERLRSLAPLAAISLAWMGLSATAGYGVRGSGVYLDPRQQPLWFVRGVQERYLGLLELQFGIPAEFSNLLPASARSLVAGVSWAYLWLLAAATMVLWRRSPQLRFCALAGLGALLPQCAAGSFARLLPLSGLAAHGLVAIIVQELFQRARARRSAGLGFAVCGVLTLGIHGGVALAIPPHARAFSLSVHDSVWRAAHSLPRLSMAGNGRIVVLNFPDYLRSVFVDLYRRELFGPPLSRMDVIGISPAPVRLTRTREDVVDLEPVVGFLYEPSTLLVRQPQQRFRAGQRFELDGLQLEVTTVTADGRPQGIRLHHVSDSKRVRWYRWSRQEQLFVQIELPAVGASDWLDSSAFDVP